MTGRAVVFDFDGVLADTEGLHFSAFRETFAARGWTLTRDIYFERYLGFDDRDLIGFVDGTENPVDGAAVAATIIGDEDPDFAGGSYVIVQKYLHDLPAWNRVPVAEQERIIGREKLSDIELDDAAKPSYAHNVLTSIEENGAPLEILRDNMPFGDVGKGEFGTYFIGYARSPHRIERMLENMFIGLPPGNYEVTATLRGSSGEERATVSQQVNVIAPAGQ